jgi:hypothetical protein
MWHKLELKELASIKTVNVHTKLISFFFGCIHQIHFKPLHPVSAACADEGVVFSSLFPTNIKRSH